MLKKLSSFPGVEGPVVTIVLDGFGYTPNHEGNAIYHAYTPTLDRLFAQFPHTLLKAHGTFVGMPSNEDMGNSEVGHNAIGAGIPAARKEHDKYIVKAITKTTITLR